MYSYYCLPCQKLYRNTHTLTHTILKTSKIGQKKVITKKATEDSRMPKELSGYSFTTSLTDPPYPYPSPHTRRIRLASRSCPRIAAVLSLKF